MSEIPLSVHAYKIVILKRIQKQLNELEAIGYTCNDSNLEIAAIEIKEQLQPYLKHHEDS